MKEIIFPTKFVYKLNLTLFYYCVTGKECNLEHLSMFLVK